MSFPTTLSAGLMLSEYPTLLASWQQAWLPLQCLILALLAFMWFRSQLARKLRKKDVVHPTDVPESTQHDENLAPKKDHSKVAAKSGIVWQLSDMSAPLYFSTQLADTQPFLDYHWCAPPHTAAVHESSSGNDGLAERLPERGEDGSWRVWCFCGAEMNLECVREAYHEEFMCHCGSLGVRHLRLAGCLLWRCPTCKSSHNVSDSTGQPRGVPGSPACRALRYQGHTLVDCLGKRYAYQSVLKGEFHFGSAGISASVGAIGKLRRALVTQRQKELLCLHDDEYGQRALTTCLPTLNVAMAETLLHGYAAAGRLILLNTLLEACVCHVDARRHKDACTALHLACYHGHEGAADLLLRFGADPEAQNKWGENPAQAGASALTSGKCRHDVRKGSRQKTAEAFRRLPSVATWFVHQST